MKLTLNSLVFILTLLLILGCSSQESQKEMDDTVSLKADNLSKTDLSKKYLILSADKLETSNKAQIKVTAFLKGEFKDKEELESILTEIYQTYRHQGGYVNFSEPTVVAAYLFGTEGIAKNDPSAWMGMLLKGPNDASPRISYNDFKINAASDLKDNVKSSDEIRLAKIQKLLSSKNIELCDLSQMVNDIELTCIRLADKRYPDYGKDHDDYSDQLIESEWRKLGKKYKLTHDQINEACTFAMAYCK